MPLERAELRRSPRLPARCRAWMQDRFGLSRAETEDVGPRGCRVVTQRAPAVGALVRLTLGSDRVQGPLAVTGQVVWVRPGPDARAGISFAGSAADAWFRALQAAEEARGAGGIARAEPAKEREVPPPEPLDASPEAVARRLVGRAQELLLAGDAETAEVILRRALAFAPGDAAIQALLAGIAARRP